MNSPNGHRLGRRRLLRTGMAGALASGTALPTRIFAQTSERQRPQIPFGVQTGDFADDGAMVWAATTGRRA